METSENTKLEVALEIISFKIALLSQKGYSVESSEMKQLLNERKEMYLGNKDVKEKIINIYGPEIKNNKGVEQWKKV